VTWGSSNTAVARVDSSGYVTSVAVGTATITATSGGISGTATVTVYVSSPTTVILNQVADTLLTGHHVQLIASAYDQMGYRLNETIDWTTSDPTVATVDTTGQVRGIAPGYVDIMAVVGGAGVTKHIKVVLAPPSPSIAGDWTMTLSASPSCSNQLPALARQRQFTVHFTQQGDDFRLTITSPTLAVANSGEDGGTLLGSSIAFGFIGDTDYGTWSTTDLHDDLGNGTTLDFDGIVTGLASGSEIHATMSGDLEIGPYSMDGPAVICRATDHTVILRRP